MITLDEIKDQQSKLTALIASFEEQARIAAAFPIEVALPELNAGEKWAGVIVAEDGKTKYHLILLAGDSNSATWKDQMKWAKDQDGDLPDRVEQALLFKYLRDEFKKEAYWSNTPRPDDDSYAFYQGFINGSQDSTHKIIECRARAVRRLVLQ